MGPIASVAAAFFVYAVCEARKQAVWSCLRYEGPYAELGAKCTIDVEHDSG